MPVAQAIANALSSRPGSETLSDMPISPSSIVSTSYPGIALMDYRKKGGEEELDVVKDDALRVFKRYNHWSYVCLIASLLVTRY
jgi:protein STE50